MYRVVYTESVSYYLCYRYDVFSLDLPMMQYNITLDLLEFQGISVDETGAKHANWTQVSKLHLNPSQTLGRSSDGRVRLNPGPYLIHTSVTSMHFIHDVYMYLLCRWLQRFRAVW